jgi:hypothetical protein
MTKIKARQQYEFDPYPGDFLFQYAPTLPGAHSAEKNECGVGFNIIRVQPENLSNTCNIRRLILFSRTPLRFPDGHGPQQH